jgi:hypothetical protein
VTAPQSAEPFWTGPAWEDHSLTVLARQLRDAHGRVAPLPGAARQRLHRHLLAITDLAKRDPALAARRLETFLTDLETGTDRSAWPGETG